MDRLAGTQSNDEVFSMPFQLVQPYGIAVDSTGHLYVADQKVGAIFIFTTDEPKERGVDQEQRSRPLRADYRAGHGR